MTPKNEREELTADLTFCAFHTDVVAIGWRDVQNEDGTTATIGVCFECAGLCGAKTEVGELVTLSVGGECLCGPGFCANDRGVGFYGGRCNTQDREPAPDCARCGAGHQSTRGCWACHSLTDDDFYLAKASVYAVEHSVAWIDVFDFQDKNPGMDFMDALIEFVRQRDA